MSRADNLNNSDTLIFRFSSSSLFILITGKKHLHHRPRHYIYIYIKHLSLTPTIQVVV